MGLLQVRLNLASDPGSIGGLADAAVAGALPGEWSVPPSLIGIARRFRAERRASEV